MIPATNNQLLISEDWKKVYQSFKNADFKSYDFETLRRTMISYLREKYPEDFNDYIDSSEYIALIDLIAFIGQNLSFRVDLNARDNFLETAERRDSVLRLAQLVSYNAKRNIPASGLLKIVSVSTTESVIDSSGTNLANSVVLWNDSTNINWYQQFISIMNSAFSYPSQFGNPNASSVINGVLTEQYLINSSNTNVPLYSFTKSISGTQMNFEIVSSTFAEQNYVYEEAPRPANRFALLFRNDNRGSGSTNTGFFVHFKQGSLTSANFTISNPVPNELVGINVNNINDSDVWLWQLDERGVSPQTLWTKVPSLSGNNVIYNSIDSNQRNIYAVLTRNNDQIDLSFADGNFGNLPNGQFTLFYRQSNGLNYSIKPEQMNNISIRIPYRNSAGQNHTLNMLVSLQYTVSNSSAGESDQDIKIKAPQTYYTQNRMITGEDYNIAPLNVSPDIVKVKSINRVSSGISKYYELNDVSGTYSSTNIFATDGILYKQEKEEDLDFSFTTRNQIFSMIKTTLSDIISSPGVKSLYLDESRYPRIDISGYGIEWVQSTTSVSQTTGYIGSATGPVAVGSFSSNNLKFLKPGSLVKFIAPAGFFTENREFTTISDDTTVSYVWAKVVSVAADGTANGIGTLPNGIGPVVITGKMPSGAVPIEIIPSYQTALSYSLEVDIANLVQARRNFGLSFNNSTRSWFIISDGNINFQGNFSLEFQGDITNLNRDSSWLVSYEWTGKQYKIRYRTTRYIFESQKQTTFYVDSSTKNFDYVNNQVIKDRIDILSINKSPTSSDAIGIDYTWQIDSSIVESDGYLQPRKVLVSFYDKTDDGAIDDPDQFNNIVSPQSNNLQTGFRDKFVYFRISDDGSTQELYTQPIISYPTPTDVPIANRINGQLYYFYNLGVIQSWESSTFSFNLEPRYIAYVGRRSLKFQYMHNASRNQRLDPSKMNIIDIYLLSRNYDLEYRNWLSSGVGDEPLPPTSESLESNYSSVLEPIKGISDSIIYHPAKYKVLFGPTATPSLQATFKAVQSSSSTLSVTSLQTRILSAINDFFAIENWDFGQTFNFGELVTYVLNIMTPDITNFVIVPKSSSNSFGSLFEVTSQSNEIFVSGATVNDIQIIKSITATEINSSPIVTSSQ